MWHLVLSTFIRYVYFIRYLALHAAVTIIMPLFGHPNVAVIQMSRSDTVILSFVFQSHVSGFIVKSYYIANRRDFFMA